ncbi:MAG: diacylglycerol kinase family protein [Bacteroidetes bacterium]|nr:diacylglycerol kinase family protein [Bacteroidota bacterium]
MKDRNRKFSLADRLRSFWYAFNGIKRLIADEHNFRIHLLALLLIITAGILVGITTSDWLAIIFVSALVLISESFNSSIERLSDAVNPGIDDRIRKAKDIAAAAVLISAVAAIITGLLVFAPYLLKFINN